MPFFDQTVKWVNYSSIPGISTSSVYPWSTLTNWNTKLLETVCWFYVYSMCFLWHNELLFIRSITREYNFINIVKKMSKILCSIFLSFCPNFWQIKTFVVRLHPLNPQLLRESSKGTNVYQMKRKKVYQTIPACRVMSHKIPGTLVSCFIGVRHLACSATTFQSRA